MFRMPINKSISMSVSRSVSTQLTIMGKYTFRVSSTKPTVYRITESGAYRVTE